jgi:exosortase
MGVTGAAAPAVRSARLPLRIEREQAGPALLVAVAFAALFAKPIALLVRDWWNSPDAGHGLLLAPLALWLAWRSGLRAGAGPNMALGIPMLIGAVLLRFAAGLASELFTMRMSIVIAAAALTVCYFGLRQVRHWWLPFSLLALSIPLPELVLGAIALPLQFTASKLGASLLAWRQIPVLLSGNVIRLPGGHDLYVAEACSGLRSLTALISLGVLLGGIALRHPLSRVLLIAIAIPVAILINGVRVFLTGFLVFFVSPELGQGFMHTTEGWLLFVTAFAALGAFTLVLRWVERRLMGHEDGPRPPSDDADTVPTNPLPEPGGSYSHASANA